MSFLPIAGGSKGTNPGNVTTLAYALPWTVVVGDLLIVACNVLQGVSTVYTITDSTGNNTWHQTNASIGPGTPSAYFAWCIVGAGGGGASVTVTLTASVGDFMSMCVDEFRSSDGSAITIGTLASGTAGSGTAYSSGNCSFSGAGNQLLYGFWCPNSTNSGTSNITVGAGWTQSQAIGGAGGEYFLMTTGYQINKDLSQSPIAATATGPNNVWVAVCLPFRETPRTYSGTNWGFVQNGGVSNSTNATTIVIKKTVTSGHLVRLDLAGNFSSSAAANQQWKITDNAGVNNVWIQAAHVEGPVSGGAGNFAESWYAVMGSSGAVTFTATAPTSGAYQTLGFTEWSFSGGNWVTVVPGSQLTSFNAGYSATATLGTISVAQPGDLIFGNLFFASANGYLITSCTAGFAIEYSQMENPGLTGMGCLDMIATSTAPQTIQLTASGTIATNFCGAALRVVTLPAIPASFTVQYESDSGVYSDGGSTHVAIGGTIQQWNDLTATYNLAAGTKPVWAVTNNSGHGLPGVHFTAGSSQYLLDSYQGERGTVLAVYILDKCDVAYGVMGADSNDNSTVGAYYMKACSATATWPFPAGAATWSRATQADTALPLALESQMSPTWNLSTIHGGRTDVTGGSLKTRVYNGGNLVQTTTSASSIRAVKANTSVAGCTRDSLANSNYLSGTLYALYESATDVSDVDFAQAVSRLALKYCVPQSLASLPPATYVGAFFQNPGSGLVAGGSTSEFGGTDRMYLVQSTDGVNLTSIPSVFTTTTANNGQKDIDIIYYQGQYLMVYSALLGYDQGTPFFGIATSPDMIHWTLVYDVPFASLFFVISPHLFVDPTTGLLHCFFSANPSSSAFAGVQIYETHPTVPGVLTAWSAAVLVYPVGSYGSGSGACDPFYVYNSGYSAGAGPHQIWFGAEGTLRSVQVASCATVAGTYTDTKTGNWAGWTIGPANTTQEMEGPFLRQLPSGLWQIWFDGGVLSTVANYGYWTTTSISSDPLSTWNTVCTQVVGPFGQNGRVQHGRLIVLPDIPIRAGMGTGGFGGGLRAGALTGGRM